MDIRRDRLIFSIVLAYGATLDAILDCLDSLLMQGDVQIRIVLVQNGASENIISELESKYPAIVFIKNEKNEGAAEGRNIGIRYAFSQKPDYLLFVDSDAILEKDAVLQLLYFAEQSSDEAILGCLFFRKDQRDIVFSAGANIQNGFEYFHFTNIPKETSIFEVDFIGTGAMLVPAAILSQIGLFDKDLFLSDEDVDLCLRARKLLGYKTYVVAGAKAYHDAPNREKILSPRQLYYRTRNLLVISKRYSYYRSCLGIRFVSYVLKGLIAQLTSLSGLSITRAYAFTLAVFHACTGILGECPALFNRPINEYPELRYSIRISQFPMFVFLRQLWRKV
jgi:GT2 family glycosyltransferase